MRIQPPSLLSQPTELAEPAADVCPTCGGDGYLESDAFTARRGHYSVTEACPACTERIGDDYEPSELHDAKEARRGEAAVL